MLLSAQVRRELAGVVLASIIKRLAALRGSAASYVSNEASAKQMTFNADRLATYPLRGAVKAPNRRGLRAI
jgi:hypothetical protein